MSKSLSIGVNGTARKVKKISIGIDGVARNVKNAYIGINGVARSFFTDVSPILAENSWDTIRAISDAGLARQYWNIGDSKKIIINGNVVGAKTYNNLEIEVFIIGFDHNAEHEGSNRIHFRIGKVNGKQVALVDDHYNSNGYGLSSYFKMTTSDANAGGWASSYGRNHLLGNNGTPANPTAQSLMAALPSDLRAVLKPVTKYSDNTGGGTNAWGYVTATTDYLFLPSEFEIYGYRYQSNSNEQSYQKQYEYYANGGSIPNYRHDLADANYIYGYTRSVCATNNGWCLTSFDNSPSAIHTGVYSYGFPVCFCV